MRKILGLTVAALLVMGLVGGGTWAFFSDTESITGNSVAAGTLTLSLGGSDIVAIDINDVVPGTLSTVAMQTTLQNGGSVAGDISVNMSNLLNIENGILDPESDTGDDTTGVGELGSKLQIAIFLETDDDQTYDAGEKSLKSDGTVATTGPLWATFNSYNGSAVWSAATLGVELDASGGANDSIDIVVLYKWDNAADASDNVAMSDEVTFDMGYELRQAN